jgi:hypothetical protein
MISCTTGDWPGHAVVAHDQGRAARRNAWLDVFCPGCGTGRAIDLRTLDRDPLAQSARWCSAWSRQRENRILSRGTKSAGHPE